MQMSSEQMSGGSGITYCKGSCDKGRDKTMSKANKDSSHGSSPPAVIYFTDVLIRIVENPFVVKKTRSLMKLRSC